MYGSTTGENAHQWCMCVHRVPTISRAMIRVSPCNLINFAPGTLQCSTQSSTSLIHTLRVALTTHLYQHWTQSVVCGEILARYSVINC